MTDPAFGSTIDSAAESAVAPTINSASAPVDHAAATDAGDDRSTDPLAATFAGGSQETAPAGGASSADRTLPSPSRQLGGALVDGGFHAHYRSGAQLGEGGMGVVRLYHDLRIGRAVAMKVSRKGVGSSPTDSSRFLREARIQGQLEHPAIVPVYEMGRDPEGALYFTMKRIRGISLEQVLEGLSRGDAEFAERYSRRKLLSAFCSVCLAVEFAHARGILHRDLKPANVMLGDYGEVYLLDWGVAKVLGAAEPAAADTRIDPVKADLLDEEARTLAGTTMGTPGYMAPEQARGEVEKLDARTDVYALGAILFELLTLERLHHGGGSLQLIASTLSGADARPSVRAPQAQVPPELEAICRRATALLPAERYPSVQALERDVERFLDGDRDLERRREMARAHVESAELAAERALRGPGKTQDKTHQDRALAMREIGRALALDPTNTTATRTLVRLLTEPPAEMPPEARAEIDALRQARQVRASRVHGYSHLSFFLTLPFVLYLGVLSYTAFFVCYGLFAVATVACFHLSRHPNPGGRIPTYLTVTVLASCAGTSTFFGPHIFLPMLVTINTLSLMMAPDRSHRLRTVALALLALFIPLGLEWTGVVSPSYRFESGVFQVLPHMFAYSPVAIQAILLTISITLVLVVAIGGAHGEDWLYEAEERHLVMTWQLRQIVATDSAPAPSANDSANSGPAVSI